MASIPAVLVKRVLSHAWVRAVIILLWLIVVALGSSRFHAFRDKLVTGSAAPAGSQAAVAQDKYSEFFGENPLSLSVIASSCDDSPIINTTFDVQSRQFGSTDLSLAAANVSADLQGIAAEQLGPACEYTFTSYWHPLPNSSNQSSSPVVEDLAKLSLEKRLFTQCGGEESTACVRASSTIYEVVITTCEGHVVQNTCVSAGKAWCDPIADVSRAFRAYADAANARTGQAGTPSMTASGLELSVVSFPDIVTASLDGVDETMTLSTMTAPVALGLLGWVLRNLRQLLLTLAAIAGCITATIIVMDPLAGRMQVSSQAPALMIAVGLAMSIDYSLFLLTRFNDEVHSQRQPIPLALQATLETSGHTVLVSGTTLCLCFLGMLLIPVTSIASMGIAAAITVAFAICFALVLTPTLLLSCPHFFTANRRFGLSLEGCLCCASSTAHPPVLGNVAAVDAPQTSEALLSFAFDREAGSRTSAEDPRGLWPRLGQLTQRPVLSVILLVVCVAVAIPFAIPLSRMSYVEGMLPTMPRQSYTTASFEHLLSAFGVSSIFPEHIVIVPPSANSTSDLQWLNASCLALQHVASLVNVRLVDEGCTADGSPCQMSAADFEGVMMLSGQCTAQLLTSPEAARKPTEVSAALGLLRAQFDSANEAATRVTVQTRLDPFSESTGQRWMRALRDELNSLGDEYDGVPLGAIYFTSQPLDEMDAATETFNSLPRVVGATLGIVCVVLLVSFRSALMPIRAVLCLVWMLVVTFGSAIAIYQDGALDGLHWGSLQPVGGGLFWMSPCIAFSIVVGLGLDYDIFFMESVVEFYDAGYDGKTAVVKGLEQTGNTICVAGVIMFLAFGPLVLGDSPTLNQIGYLLCVGVLLDCFVTTKVIIPSAMALIPAAGNFWPRQPLKR